MCSSDFKPKQTRFTATILCLHERFLVLGNQVPITVAVFYTSRHWPNSAYSLHGKICKLFQQDCVSCLCDPWLSQVAGWINILLESHCDKVDVCWAGRRGRPISLHLSPWTFALWDSWVLISLCQQGHFFLFLLNICMMLKDVQEQNLKQCNKLTHHSDQT